MTSDSSYPVGAGGEVSGPNPVSQHEGGLRNAKAREVGQRRKRRRRRQSPASAEQAPEDAENEDDEGESPSVDVLA